jgi:mono/diheme cytochrome c family protein
MVAMLVLQQVSTLAADNDMPAPNKPKISLDAQSFDFGNVDEGAQITHTFKVKNTGKTVLQLLRAYASCGCTTLKLAKKTLEPGEMTDLKITVDTSMKHDAVTKTVHISSNDSTRPIVGIDLKMFVRNPHRAMTAEGKAKIFEDDHCASCHVARGFGEFGRNLYNADCAMCHGPKAEGASGPTLIGPYENQVYAKHIKDVIAHGMNEHTFMPAFGGDAGGPLAKAQIDSLVTYLKDLSNLRLKKK